MAIISGRQAFLDLLHQEGIATIFGNPGTTELPLMDALSDDDRFRYILGLQEAVVTSMADGYAQASRGLTMLNLHATPGLGNAMGMLYNARESASPILVTAGQQDQSFLISEPILHGDLTTLASPLVKWSYEVRTLRDLPVAVHRAAKTALSPPTGPVFLSLPGDILMDEADIGLGAPSRVASRIRSDRSAISAAATLLAKAERPLIMAGDSVVHCDAIAEIVALAEIVGAPVYAEAVANTASFPGSHPLFAGELTRNASVIRRILEQHDLLFSVGADLLTLSLPSSVVPVPAGLTIIHLDTDPWEIGKNFPTEVGLFGDPKATLPELSTEVARRMDDAARMRATAYQQTMHASIRQQREQLVARALSKVDRSPVEALSLLHAIGRALPTNAVVIEESLSSSEGIRQLIQSNDSQSFFGLRGGGIGWGLPAALGVKLALPNRPVVALIGDGSAMYTIQGLWSAAHYGIAVIFVILNNRSYRILKQRTNAIRKPENRRNAYVAMDLENPAIDFIGLAASLGVKGYRATTISEVVELIQSHLNTNLSVLIDVEIERSLSL